MSELPPDLPRLRTLETWLVLSLDRVRRRIAEAERQESEQRRGEKERPPDPDWLIEMGLGGRAPVYVHVGGCHMAGKRSQGVTREQARRALWEQVPGCPHCGPDAALGVLD
ncbi:DUF6233 domain-containing protein [Streptomyces sp. NPDC046821]|uniref:DUF6233 domain-containing protein n=1 Tax=Streptomyces sp. NPDC046821 TaxID=3154702 RepID=UPI0033FC604B